MTKYTELYRPNVTPQSEPISGRETEMVKNDAGGYVFGLDAWKKLERFLILGSDQPTYYVGAQELTRRNADNVVALIKKDGVGVIDRVVEISKSGRAYKNDPALFVLALAFSEGNDETKTAARQALPEVARIGTHLFAFVDMVNDLRGWGSALKKAVASWYQEKDAKDLAYQITKYAQRNGWSHRDVLRLAHPKAKTFEKDVVYGYATGKYPIYEMVEPTDALIYLSAVDAVKEATSGKEAARLIRGYNLPREVVPTEFFNSLDVWDALLNPGEGRFMPMTAMIRNLGVMTSKELLKPMGSHSRMVVDRLVDEDALRKARIHPIQILAALLTYRNGHGARGSLSWTPVGEIVDALDEAFYLSFGLVEPTNKRRLMGLDISGSMTWNNIAGVPGLTPNVASAALAMVAARTERSSKIMGFANDFRELGITPRQTLVDAMVQTQMYSFGGTDCALPMLYALANDLPIDSFEIYTDGQTWAGRIHPIEALNKYRKETGIPATLTVVSMEASEGSIGDPNDSGTLDVVGFDTNTPRVISDFVAGKL